jgi:hypothetical protein
MYFGMIWNYDHFETWNKKIDNIYIKFKFISIQQRSTQDMRCIKQKQNDQNSDL